MLNRVTIFCLLSVAAACVSSTSDLPVVSKRPESGDPVYILAAGERGYPYAARGQWGVATQLAADLESAGFVPSIVLDEAAVPHGAPTIEPILPRGKCYSHAFLTVFTAGVIPELGCREYGHRFKLRCPNQEKTVEVNARFKVRSYVGWLVWPLALSPNWVYEDEGPPMQRREEVLYLRQQLQDALRGEECAA